jgi:ATP-dependent Clp protease ATP-binding subunit ClpA
MFERFTDSARAVVEAAQLEAQDRAASSVRSEHLLAALLTVPDTLGQAALVGLDVDLPALLRTVRELPDDADPLVRPPADDAQALAALGIDLAEVRRRIEEAFGPGALERTRAAQGGRASRRRPRWDRSAKKVLELSLREALHLRHGGIGTEHVLLGLLHPGTGAAQQVLAGAGVRLDTARLLVAELVRGRAAG